MVLEFWGSKGRKSQSGTLIIHHRILIGGQKGNKKARLKVEGF